MRLRKRSWVKEELMGSLNYFIESPEEHKGNWGKVFNNLNPIHAELGTGRGNFITTYASDYPTINFIAIEKRQEVLVQALRKAKLLGLTNIRFVLGDVNDALNFFAENEIACIYLNFVDPWPKTRHAKRRLTHNRFLTMYRHILNNIGEIHLKTDNEQLFEFSLNELSKNDFKLNDISLNLYRNQENFNNHIQTEYEKKFIKLGKPIYRLEATSKNKESI
ncbi:MAG: tRNA (guanosine(46)-N7)-methyltransferase TrmB [Vulcanibacillus sp.]